MRRQCDRPGCSAPAALVYRMVPERLVFWMAPIDDAADTDGGVICQRHADRLVLPRGWTLDDRRDPTLRLFRPRLDDGQPSGGTRRPSRPKPEPVGEQLTMGSTTDATADPAEVARAGSVAKTVPSAGADSNLDVATDVDRSAREEDDRVAATERPAWAPTSGSSEPVEGEVRSSLLARAFGLKRRG